MNFWLFGAIIISVIFTISFVEIPFLQNFLGTTGLDIKEWIFVTMVAFTVLIEEIHKLLRRRYA